MALRASLTARVTGEAWYRMGEVRTAKDDREGAEEAYRAAIRAKPSLAEAWLNLGSILYFQPRLEDAVDAYRGYLRVASDAAPTATRARRREAGRNPLGSADVDSVGVVVGRRSVIAIAVPPLPVARRSTAP